MRIKDTRVEAGTWVVGLAILGLGAFAGLLYLPLESARVRLEDESRRLDEQIQTANGKIAKTNMDQETLARRKATLTDELATMRRQQTLSYLFEQLSRCHAAMGLDVSNMLPTGVTSGRRGPKKSSATAAAETTAVEPRCLMVHMRTRFFELPEYLAAVDAVPGWAFIKSLNVAVPISSDASSPTAGSDLDVRMTVTTFAYNDPATAQGGQP